MSQVSSDLFTTVSTAPAGATAGAPRQSPPEGGFDEHLWRAQTGAAPESHRACEAAANEPEEAPPDEPSAADGPACAGEEPDREMAASTEPAEDAAAESGPEGSTNPEEEEESPAKAKGPEDEPSAAAQPAAATAAEERGAKQIPAAVEAKQKPERRAEKKGGERSASGGGGKRVEAAAAKAQAGGPAEKQAAPETSKKAAPAAAENQPPSTTRERRAAPVRASGRAKSAEEGKTEPGVKDAKTKPHVATPEVPQEETSGPARQETAPLPVVAGGESAEPKQAAQPQSSGKKKSAAPARAEPSAAVEVPRAASAAAAVVAVAREAVAPTGDEPGDKKPAPAEAVGPSSAASPDRAVPLAEQPAADRGGVSEVEPGGKGDKGVRSRQAEHVRFAQRVSRAFEALGQRNGSLRLKLSPPELGSLRLEITVRQGVLSARMEAETPAARNLLLESLGALRDRLAQQEIRVERFDVELMDRQPGGSPEQPGGQQEPGRQAPHRPPTAARAAEAVAAGEGRPTATSGESSHLNVVI